jgi:DNA-binding NarL/FixJ family response regulator
MEILHLVSQGHSNRDIAAQLFISENTVKYHMKRILEKLHLENRTQVAAWAARNAPNGAKPPSP